MCVKSSEMALDARYAIGLRGVVPAFNPPKASTASLTSGSSMLRPAEETTLVPRELREIVMSSSSLPFLFIPLSCAWPFMCWASDMGLDMRFWMDKLRFLSASAL